VWLAAGDRPRDDGRPPVRLTRQAELGGERPGVGCLAFDDGDAAGLRERACVDEIDPLGDRRLEQAAQDGRRQGRRVELGELAGDLERQRPDATTRELGEEPAEDLGEWQVGGDRPGRLRREQRRFTA